MVTMKKKILIVDDDRDILKVLQANLEINNFSVSTSESWKQAEELLNTNSFDLLILDIMLPDKDGNEICCMLRQSGVSFPIIMLTARDKLSDKVTGLECGADDYVVKPFETLELVARIRACLRRTSITRAPTIEVGNIYIDNRTRTVKVREAEIELTPKEYDLLLLLITHRGEVLSRKRIRKSVWKDSSLYSWSRVIDVHIQHIRQKIEKDASQPEYIITISGVGYMFKIPMTEK
jgi:DNA-binding response OmpR family regulator